MLEKPVYVVGDIKAFQSLPSDIQDLCVSIRRRHRFHEFIPGEIQDEFSALLKYRDDTAEDTWFAPKASQAAAKSRQMCLEEMGTALDIQYRAQECAMLHRHEAAWNSKVHDPLLTLAFDDYHNNDRARDAVERAAEDLRLELVHVIRVENVTSATVTEDCVPRWKSGKDTSSETASVLAWSLSEVSTSSSNSGSTGGGDKASDDQGQGQRSGTDPFTRAGRTQRRQQHSKTGSKKVDFALTIAPKEGTSLHAAIEARLGQLRETSPSILSINPFDYTPLVSAPIAVVIKSKTATSTEDPILQLGAMACAIHRRLHMLGSAQGLAAGPSLLTETGVLMTYPLIAITDHYWEMYFACDRGKSIEVVGPVELGSTRTFIQTYMLIASLRLLRTWILDYFCHALEEWLVQPSL